MQLYSRLLLMCANLVLAVIALAHAVATAGWSMSFEKSYFGLMHVATLVLAVLTYKFLSPYWKLVWGTLQSIDKYILGVFVGCAFISAVLGAFEVSWAPVELFFSLLWCTVSLQGYILIRNLPRVRTDNA